jgi:hypothetical protein
MRRRRDTVVLRTGGARAHSPGCAAAQHCHQPNTPVLPSPSFNLCLIKLQAQLLEGGHDRLCCAAGVLLGGLVALKHLRVQERQRRGVRNRVPRAVL